MSLGRAWGPLKVAWPKGEDAAVESQDALAQLVLAGRGNHHRLVGRTFPLESRKQRRRGRTRHRRRRLKRPLFEEVGTLDRTVEKLPGGSLSPAVGCSSLYQRSWTAGARAGGMRGSGLPRLPTRLRGPRATEGRDSSTFELVFGRPTAPVLNDKCHPGRYGHPGQARRDRSPPQDEPAGHHQDGEEQRRPRSPLRASRSTCRRAASPVRAW